MLEKLKSSTVWFFGVGLVGSSVIGLLESQIITTDRGYWKAMIFLFLIMIGYTAWGGRLEKYSPLIPNMMRFIITVVVLLIPYTLVIAKYSDVPIQAIIDMTPAQIIFLAVMYIWFSATELDPDLDERANLVLFKGSLLSLVILIVLGINFNIFDSDMLGLSTLALLHLMYVIYIFLKAKKKANLRLRKNDSSSEEAQ